MIWKPDVTVAAVVQRDGKFLLVEEETEAGLAFNQPAGHLEDGESLLEAVVREALEETAYHFKPTHLVGIYNWKHPKKDVTYLRFAFAGELRGYEAGRPLDEGIVGARWMTLDEVKATQARHRSPLILRCIEDFLAGRNCSLDMLVHYN
jgi:8-oxo-dGTP pyrophosphatase MutT (NUDIX family)